MADATLQHDSVQHGIRGEEFEAPLFGAYSKKVGMWLFLASDSLTFGALLVAFSYNRISNPAWPTPFAKESARTVYGLSTFFQTLCEIVMLSNFAPPV